MVTLLYNSQYASQQTHDLETIRKEWEKERGPGYKPKQQWRLKVLPKNY